MEAKEVVALMDDSISFAVSLVDKNGTLHVGLRGDCDAIVLGIAKTLMCLSENTGTKLEELGDMLNMAVEELQKGGKQDD